MGPCMHNTVTSLTNHEESLSETSDPPYNYVHHFCPPLFKMQEKKITVKATNQ